MQAFPINTKPCGNRAFTLIELVVGMVLTAIIVLIVTRSVILYRPAIMHLQRHEQANVKDVFTGSTVSEMLSSSGIAGLAGSFFIPCPGGTCSGNAVAVRRSETSGIITSGAGTAAIEFRPAFFSTGGTISLPAAIHAISFYTIDGDYRGSVSTYQNLSCEGALCSLVIGAAVPADALLIEINVEHVLVSCEANQLKIFRTAVADNPFAFNAAAWVPSSPSVIADALTACSVGYVTVDADGAVTNTAAAAYTDGALVRAATIHIERKKDSRGTAREAQDITIVRNLE